MFFFCSFKVELRSINNPVPVNSEEAKSKSNVPEEVIFGFVIQQAYQYDILYCFNFQQEHPQPEEPEPNPTEIMYWYRCFGNCQREWTSRRVYRPGGIRNARAECPGCKCQLLPIRMVTKLYEIRPFNRVNNSLLLM